MEHLNTGNLLLALIACGIVLYLNRVLPERVPRFKNFKLEAVAALTLAGLICGPSMLGLVGGASVAELAHWGGALILFRAGLHFSFDDIKQMWREVLIGGGLSMAAIAGVGGLMLMLLGSELSEALVWGALVSMSSTALIVEMLRQRAELNTPWGRIAIGILLAQDIGVVPLSLVLGAVAPGGLHGSHWAVSLIKGVAILVGLLFVARKLYQPLIVRTLASGEKTLFPLVVILLCLGTAWVTELAGISMAFGFFLAGLVVAESEVRDNVSEASETVVGVLGGIFFFSLGMLLDLQHVAEHLPQVLGLLVMLLVVKGIGIYVPVRLLGYPMSIGILTAAMLSQVGEFAFVLAKQGVDSGLLGVAAYNRFLAVGALSLLLTTFLDILTRGAVRRWGHLETGQKSKEPAILLQDHVLLVGFGPANRHLAHALEAVRVPFAVIDLNYNTVRELRTMKTRALWGSASSPVILNRAAIGKATELVVCISDDKSVPRIVRRARSLNSDLHIVARVSHLADRKLILAAGANEVIAEDFAGSEAVRKCVLTRRNVEAEVQDRLSDEIRRFEQ